MKEKKETAEEKSVVATEPKETKLVAKLNVYYDKVLKTDIMQGTVIKDVYDNNGVKLTKQRIEELLKAGVAEIQK